MTEQKKKIHKRDKALVSLLVLGLLALFVAFLLMLRSNGVFHEVIRLDKGWTVTYQGQSANVESLSNYTFPQKIHAGDSLVVEGELPPNTPSRAVLRIRTFHTAVAVYGNGKLLYKYDNDNTGMNFVGSGYHYVYLDSFKEGQKLKVVFVEQVDGRTVSLASFDLMPAEYVMSDYPARHIFALIVGVFLVLFGILAIAVSMVTRLFGISYFRSLMIGLLSFLLGTWTLCYTKVIQTVSFNLGLNTTLEYFCLYLSALPFTLLLWNMHREHLTRVKNVGFAILATYEVLFTSITTFLHLNSIVYYPRTLVLFHTSVVVGFAFFIYAGVFFRKKMDLSGKILTQGVVLFGLTMLIDLIRFHLDRILTVNSPLLEMTWLPLGTLVLVVLLVQSYIIHLFYILEDRAEKGALATMAYLDALTGLYNRAKCQQIFDVLDKGYSDYAIVSIDMNGLKLVNDNYGHNAGDKLIKTFANVFKEAFTGIGTTIRVGGDEFLAIVRSEHVADVDATLAKMAELQESNSVHLPVPLETAYGIAYRHELFKDDFVESSENIRVEAESVYHLADERMYAMKASMKSELVRK